MRQLSWALHSLRRREEYGSALEGWRMEQVLPQIQYQSPNNDSREVPLDAVREPDGTAVWRLPASIGQGQVIKTHLRSGLTVSVSECTFCQSYTSRIHREQRKVFLIVPLSGTTLIDNVDRTMPVQLNAGQIYCYRPGGFELVRISAANDHNANIVVELPEDGLGVDITTGLCRTLGWPSRCERPRIWSAEISLATRCAAEQLHCCALFGFARALFCEAKVLDLVVRVMQAASGPTPLTHCRSMGAENRRAFLAAELITEDLENPPSLFELARQVRLSHTDLNRRFRELFGCTAFEYLRRERLRRAREMMEQGKFSLTQVAMATGFCSSSHFSRAFAKEFGMNPSRYRASVLKAPAASVAAVSTISRERAEG